MSATTVSNATRTFTNGSGALGAYILVKVASDGTLAASDSSDDPVVGFTTTPAAASESTTVSLMHGGGTSFATASKAIAIGDLVYNTTGGKLTDASGTEKIGVALSAAAADGDVFEVLTAK